LSQILYTKNEIRSHFNAAEFVSNTRAQVNKDLAGLSITEIPNHNSEIDPLVSLQNDLMPIIEELNNAGNLSQFIYKVDLPEKLFQEALFAGNYDELSYLIIQREAQKVFLRRKFRTE
jgi:hypothetical protein